MRLIPRQNQIAHSWVAPSSSYTDSFPSARPSVLDGPWSLLTAAARGACCVSAAKQRALLFRSQLEHIAYQKIGVVLRISMDTRREPPGENPATTFAMKQTGRHSSPRSDFGRVCDPAGSPRRLQALASQQEIRRAGVFVVSRIACRIAFQARRRPAGE